MIVMIKHLLARALWHSENESLGILEWDVDERLAACEFLFTEASLRELLALYLDHVREGHIVAPRVVHWLAG